MIVTAISDGGTDNRIESLACFAASFACRVQSSRETQNEHVRSSMGRFTGMHLKFPNESSEDRR
jgi:hypothetical protein